MTETQPKTVPPTHSPTQHQPFLSVAYVNVMLEVLESMGIERDAVLKNTHISEEQLLQDHYLIPFSGIKQLFKNGAELTQMPAQELGYLIGKKTNVNAIGAPGLAALSSADLKSVLKISTLFTSILMPGLVVDGYQEGELCCLRAQLNLKLPAEDREVLYCTFIGNSRALLNTLIGGVKSVENQSKYKGMFSVDLPIPEMNFIIADRLSQETKLKFNTEYHVCRFPKELLKFKLPLANRSAANKYLEECKSIRNSNQIHFVTRIRQALMESEYQFPSLEDFASQFHVSSRTLHRLLATEGYSYRSLLKEVKMQRAAALFDNTDISVKAAASLLGYSDNTNFTKAFKNTFSLTPSAYIENRTRKTLIPS